VPMVGAVRLRPVKDWHLVIRIGFCRDAELAKLMGVREFDPHLTVDDLRCWRTSRLEAGDTLLAIEVGDRYVGDIDVAVDRRHGSADLTLMIGDRRLRGRGVGTEVVRRVLGWLFRGDQLLVETATAPPGRMERDPGPKPEPPPTGHPFDYVEVDVARGNTRAHGFWLKQGFSPWSTGLDGTERLRLTRDRWLAAHPAPKEPRATRL